jgi:peptide/nickel transport system permease protein
MGQTVIGQTSIGRTLAIIAAAALAALVLAVVLFPSVLATHAPEANDVTGTFAPPGTEGHLLGTDQLGRDVYSRIVHGARISVTTGAIATAVGVVLGSLLGLVAASGNRLVDGLVMRSTDVWLAFPEVLLALLVISVIGPGALNVAVAIGIAATPYYARLVRGQALALRTAEYVEASRVLGVHPAVSAVRHILPNLGGPVVALASLGVGSAIAAAAGLSLLGFGPLPPTPEWGAMLAEGQSYLSTAWWIALFPGIALVAVVLLTTVLGRAIQERGRR